MMHDNAPLSGMMHEVEQLSSVQTLLNIDHGDAAQFCCVKPHCICQKQLTVNHKCTLVKWFVT